MLALVRSTEKSLKASWKVMVADVLSELRGLPSSHADSQPVEPARLSSVHAPHRTLAVILAVADARSREELDIAPLHVLRHDVPNASSRAERHIVLAVGVHDEHVGAAHLRAYPQTNPLEGGRGLELEVDIAGPELAAASGTPHWKQTWDAGQYEVVAPETWATSGARRSVSKTDHE